MAKRRKPVLRFFRKKPMENPNDAINLDEIAQTPESEQVEVVAPMEDAPAVVTEPALEESAAPTEEPVIEDPIVKNEAIDGVCEPCQGTGLKDQSTICPQCNGTGKV